MKIKIGLETHVKINLNKKLFCFCNSNINDYKPNTNVCCICLGFPGSLPILNLNIFNKIIPFLLFFKKKINSNISFDRKIYEYLDLTKNFQITQKYNPILENINFSFFDKLIIIRSISIEEDAGKMIHDKYSYIDYNRCGEALLEITTDPVFSNIEDVIKYIIFLRIIIRQFNISNLNIEKGDFRNDLNISVFYNNFNTGRMEVKNLNNINNIKNSFIYIINYVKQQIDFKNFDKVSKYVTLGWDEINNKTFFLRDKKDYLFVREFDIPNINLEKQINLQNKNNYDIIFLSKLFSILNNKLNLKILSKVISNYDISFFFYNLFIKNNQYFNKEYIDLILFFILFIYERILYKNNFNYLFLFLDIKNINLLMFLSKKIGYNNLEDIILKYITNTSKKISVFDFYVFLSDLKNKSNDNIFETILLESEILNRMFSDKGINFNFLLGESIRLLKSKKIIFDVKKVISFLKQKIK